jgi:hypothetical protein
MDALQIETLHLAGNGLSGNIGSEADMSFLLSLTLAHNYLTGVIPLWIQEKRNLTQLDLSHNKLTGDVNDFEKQEVDPWIPPPLTNSSKDSKSSKNVGRSLKLAVNRLSGDLSSSFSKYSTLDILSGNLFSCKETPKNDKNSEWSRCGSEEYDQTMIAMSSVLGLLVVGLMCYLVCLLVVRSSTLGIGMNWCKSRLDDTHSLLYYGRYYSCMVLIESKALAMTEAVTTGESRISGRGSLKETISFGYLLVHLIQSAWILTGLSLLFSLPIYVLKGHGQEEEEDSSTNSIATHSHMYRWLWTLAFLSGSLPAILLLVMTFLCLLFFSFALKRIIGKPSPDLCSNEDAFTSLPQPQSQSLQGMMWGIFLVNVIVVSTMTGLYLWSTLMDLSSEHRILSQVAVAFVSFLWNVLLKGALPTRLQESRYGLWLFIFLSLTNTVVIPCLVTALSSPSCYQVLLYL